MAAGKLAFRFTSQVMRLDQGMPFHILPVPDEAAAAWKKAKVRRLIGTVNGHAINRALMNHADGGSFLIVNRDFMKEAGINLKTPAVLAFQPDPAPDRLDLPEEFRLALDQDDAARARWDTFKPGRQRSLLVYITGAKTEPTRIKRALDLAQKIRTHALYSDLQKKSRPKL
jgi:hypothetical protein